MSIAYKTGKTILITGGARSGKSHYAQEIASNSVKQVVFVATAQAGDEEMRQRIAIHRRNRPVNWRTLEIPLEVGNRIVNEVNEEEVVLLDDITLLLNNIVGKFLTADGADIDEEKAEKAVNREIDDLVGCIRSTSVDFIIVTNEVGLGLVPDNRLGRVYRDLLGKVNQVLARVSDEVYFMVAGLPLKVKP
jgi:adenosylcobinamide kinase / adenosylcobinamide-phosphate guanylyltransferase